MKFRKKPVVIDAIQWTGKLECLDSFSIPEIHQSLGSDKLEISTLEGILFASVGDWIIKGETPMLGIHFYPVKPDYFALNYEPVTEQSAGQTLSTTIRKSLIEKYDQLAGRGIDELHNEELSEYVMHLVSSDTNITEIKSAIDWIVSELSRKTNDERVLSVKLQKLREQHIISCGWLEWHGGECPVDVSVEIRFRDGTQYIQDDPHNECWDFSDVVPGSDIVAYRIVQPEQLYENTLEIERNNSRNIALQLEQAKKVIKEAGDETQAQVERAVRMAVAHCGLAVANRAVSDEIFVRTACDVIEASVTDILRELAEPVLTSVVKESLTTDDCREPFREVWVASDGNGIARHVSNHRENEPFQRRVEAWMLACFGVEISADKIERNHRFLEESLELVQACGCSASEAHQLVDYVFNRTVGERAQEVGGVMVTLAALCLAQKIEMTQCGEIELSRIWTKVEQIRAKQAAKPKHSPLPVPATQAIGEST